MAKPDSFKNRYFPIFPDQLQIEPTNNCNLRCTICPRAVMTYAKGFMDFKLFKRITDEASANSVGSFKLYFLGEPLLNRQLFNMAKYASQRGIRIGITTNGTLINESNVEKLLRTCNSIGISMDGETPEEYEKIRVGSRYKTLKKGVELLLKRRTELNLSTFISLATVMPDDDLAVSKVVISLVERWAKPYGIYIFPLVKNDYGKNTPVKRNYVCPDGLRSLVVRWDGEVSYCCGDVNSEAGLGNVNEKSIQKMWLSQKMWRIRLDILNKQYKNPVCRRCNVFYDNRVIALPPECKRYLPTSLTSPE